MRYETIRYEELKVGDILIRMGSPSKYTGLKWEIIRIDGDNLYIRTMNYKFPRTNVLAKQMFCKAWEVYRE